MRQSLWVLATVLLTSSTVVGGTGIDDLHRADLQTVGLAPSGNFHWARDSWIGQDKLWDHASFAFMLAQLSEDQFRPDNAAERALVLTVNMVPWLLKEVIDGYAEEGASYKDFIWSGAGALLALIIH